MLISAFQRMDNNWDMDRDGVDLAVVDAHADETSKTFTGVVPGIWGLGEDALAGWVLTEIDCQSTLGTSEYLFGNLGVNIDLASGDDVTCTFVNVQTGTITIIKEAAPESEQVFNFATNIGGVNSSFTLKENFMSIPQHYQSRISPGETHHGLDDVLEDVHDDGDDSLRRVHHLDVAVRRGRALRRLHRCARFRARTATPAAGARLRAETGGRGRYRRAQACACESA